MSVLTTTEKSGYDATVTKVAGIETGADVTANHAPQAHHASHQNGGSDEVATATAGANAIPKAGAGGTLAAGWIPSLDALTAPAADVSFNSHKITSLASGTASGEAVHFGQSVTTSTNGLMLATDKTLVDQYFANGIRSIVIRQEDFITANQSATPASATVVVFNYPWTFTFQGTAAAGSIVATNQDATHFGVVDLSTGTATTGSCGIVNAGAVAWFTFGAGQSITQEWLIRIPTLSDGTNTYAIRVGMGNGTSAAPTSGIYFEYLQSTSVNWRGITNNAGASTVASGGSNVAVGAAAWIRLTMTWDGTTATFFVNGTNIGTSATNIPTASVWGFANIIKSAGGTARDVLVDYVWDKMVFATPRAA